MSKERKRKRHETKNKVILPNRTMTDSEVCTYAHQLLHLPNFVGALMKDQLGERTISTNECGIVNLEKANEVGSHWCAWFKRGSQRCYFDSFGQRPPDEVVRYLKTEQEYKTQKRVIQFNVTIVQKDLAQECGGLCLYWIHKMGKGFTFNSIMLQLKRRHARQKQSPLICIV